MGRKAETAEEKRAHCEYVIKWRIRNLESECKRMRKYMRTYLADPINRERKRARDRAYAKKKKGK